MAMPSVSTFAFTSSPPSAPRNAVPSERELRVADVVLLAKQIALARGCSWWGVEHLAEAVVRSDTRGELGAVRRQMPDADSAWWGILAGQGARSSALTPSVRLARLIEDDVLLSEAHVADTLFAHLGLQALVAPPVHGRRPASGRYEWLFGPDDGATGRLSRGDTLRDGHVRWLREGWVQLAAPTEVVDRGVVRVECGQVQLAGSAVLRLDDAWLLLR
jgi:hypothetical protein